MAKAKKDEPKAPQEETGRVAVVGKSESYIQLKTALLIAIPIILVFLAFFFVVLPSPIVTVPFSTFKSNFGSAPRVALVVTFYNESQLVNESQCYTKLLESIAYSRNVSTLDFYILNQTTCTYPTSGLGHATNVSNATASYCLNKVKTEPAIFLNYSSTNSTVITADRLVAFGNSAYMASCPIAVDIS